MVKNYTTLLLTISILLLCKIPILAQDILWEKSFGGRHAEYLNDIIPTADYGFIIAGSSLSKKSGNKKEVGHGDLDYWLWKMNEQGEDEWQKSFGGEGYDMLQSIKTTFDGGFILGGTSNSPHGKFKTEDCNGGNDFWVIKLDAKGEQLWQRTFGGKGQDDLASVILTSDGGYVLAGSSDSSPMRDDKGTNIKREKSRGNLDYWIIKLDAAGNELWQKSYGGKLTDQLRSIALTKDGGFIVGGYSNSPMSGEKSQDNYGLGGDFWILKLDDEGSIEWQQTIGGDKDDQLKVVQQARDGNYIVAGNSSSTTRTSKNGSDLWLVKLDETGVILWEEVYDISEVDILTSLVENEDKTLLLAGYSPITYSDGNEKEGVNDYVAIKISEEGKELWRKVHGSDGQDILKKIIMSRDGGYILAGTSNPEFKGYGSRKGSSSPLSALTASGKELAIADIVQQQLDGAIQNATSKLNKAVSENIASMTTKINDVLKKVEDSGFKLGVDNPVGNLLNVANGSSSSKEAFEKAAAAKGPKPGAAVSRDKKLQLGSSDFWVLKLKDNQKVPQEKTKVEAIPNPAITFTNVIVGFDFDKGTARLYDIAGRELQSIKIENRTIPFDMSQYPQGVYIVNIKTNKGEGSVKIIKGGN